MEHFILLQTGNKDEKAKKHGASKSSNSSVLPANKPTGNASQPHSSPFSQSSTVSSGIGCGMGDDERILIDDNLPSASAKQRSNESGASKIVPNHILSEELK